MTPSVRDMNRRIWWASFAIAYVGLSFVLITGSQMWTATFNDPDDYMRMAQVFNLLDGQSWYDLSHSRFVADPGFVMAWSRLVDLPLAAIMALAEPWVGRMAAAGVAAFMTPLLLLGAFCFAAPLLGRGLIPRDRCWLLVLTTLCALPVLHQLRPMRVDHHGWQLFLAMLDLLCLLRYGLRPNPKLLLLAGGVCAWGLAIGTESLVWTALTIAAVAASAAFRGGKTARDAPLFGFGLLAGILILLPVLRRPEEWLLHEMYRLSMPHVIFASLTTGVLLILHYSAEASRTRRFGVLCAVGTAALGLMLFAVPEARHGVYADMSADNQRIILGNVLEAQSMIARLGDFSFSWKWFAIYWPMIGHNILLPAIAGITLLAMLIRSRGYRRRLWAIQAAFQLPVFLLGLFWQSRVITYAQLYSLLPAAWLMAQGFRHAGGLRPWFARPACAGILMVPFLAVGLTLSPQESRWPYLLFYPSWYRKKPCDLWAIAGVLNDPKFFGDRPRSIMTTLNGGAELLFRTKHRVFSAPYNLEGNQVAYEFFSARDPGYARMVLQMHNADLVLVCNTVTALYYPDEEAREMRLSAAMGRMQGMKLLPDADAGRIMIDRLVSGEHPRWLVPVPLPQQDIQLFRVKLPAGRAEATTEDK
ncbi:MAG: hypothetical protein WDO70_03035 [Alphaproteobacteria bacterium]